MQEITHGADEYLASLHVGEAAPSEVVEVDGAVLYRVADEHFLVFACSEREHKHRGHEYLTRVLPPHWVAFHEAINNDERFTATHYGPDLDEPVIP